MKKINEINIIFSTNDRYVQHLGVTIKSIVYNKNKNTKINFYIMYDYVSEKNFKKLKILENENNIKIKYIKIEKEKYKNLKISGHIDTAAYYRIFIPDILEKQNISIKKILYLDCDIVVLKDLLELYNTDIKNYLHSAVKHDRVGLDLTKSKLGMKEQDSYFNSGVMLINVDRWRKENIAKKTLFFIENNSHKITAWDQDGLNYICNGKWKEMDSKYNMTGRNLLERKISEKDIYIVHYITRAKPWLLNNPVPFGKYYFYYLKKTPWNKWYLNYNLIIKLIIETKKLSLYLKKLSLYLKKLYFNRNKLFFFCAHRFMGLIGIILKKTSPKLYTHIKKKLFKIKNNKTP